MRHCVIWSVALFAMVGTALCQDPNPARQEATQKAPTRGKAEDASKERVVELGGGASLQLVLIPAGSFMMGDEGDSGTRPVHKVTITQPFYLGKYEVTQEQWLAVMGSNPSYFKGPKNPVEQVSWTAVQAFLGKLNAKPGLHGKFVLPTEAQWEYACRAGSATKWCSGDDERSLPEYAWYGRNAGPTPHAVGQKRPNAWGLFDMHGNVWEWCADWFDPGYYAISPAEDPQGPSSGSSRVMRGGCRQSPAKVCRSAFRYYFDTDVRADYLGLRLLLVPAK